MAQDQDYTQFYNTQVNINPAAIGNESVPRATIGYRSQWANMPGNLSGFFGAVDTYFKQNNSGVGILVNSAQGGIGSLYSTDLMAAYSYRLKLKKDWALSLGLQAGYVFRGASYSQYVFGDQLSLTGDVKSASDEKFNQTANLNYFDTGVGVLLFKDGSQFGISAYHLTMPNQSVSGNTNRLPIKVNVHLSHRFIINYRHTRTEEFITSFTPMAYFRIQGPFKQLTIGGMYDYTPFHFGVFYKGLPFLTQDGVINSDAIAPAVGVRYKGYVFGYSYDITISGLTNKTGGAHEFQMGYVFETLKPFKPKKRTTKKN